MPRTTCILTDQSVQFPQVAFSGRERVRIAPLDVLYNGVLLPEGGELRLTNLEPSANVYKPRLIPPSKEVFLEIYNNLARSYDDILVIILSAQLSPAFENAQAAAAKLQGSRPITVIDAQCTSVGLGVLVQSAAEALDAGANLVDTERLVRQMIPHIYTLVCTPNLSYLHYAGFLDHAQATIGEMLGLFPIFTLEEGRLTPLEKVRNYRYGLEYFQEFLEEYDNLKHIALLQGSPGNHTEAKILRQFTQECFPQVNYTEHTMNLPYALLFGPRAMSLMVVENPEEM